MGSLKWHKHKQSFLNTELEVSIARSSENNLIVEEWKKARLEIPTSNELTILYYPASIVGEHVGYSPKGKPIFRPIGPPVELWKVKGLGSFDSIRFARTVLGAPADEFFRGGVGSLEAMLDMLSQGFSDGEFQLVHADAAMLMLALTAPSLEVTRKQRQLLDKLNQQFFIAGSADIHMKSAHLSPPDCFVIGAP